MFLFPRRVFVAFLVVEASIDPHRFRWWGPVTFGPVTDLEKSGLAFVEPSAESLQTAIRVVARNGPGSNCCFVSYTCRKTATCRRTWQWCGQELKVTLGAVALPVTAGPSIPVSPQLDLKLGWLSCQCYKGGRKMEHARSSENNFTNHMLNQLNQKAVPFYTLFCETVKFFKAVVMNMCGSKWHLVADEVGWLLAGVEVWCPTWLPPLFTRCRWT